MKSIRARHHLRRYRQVCNLSPAAQSSVLTKTFVVPESPPLSKLDVALAGIRELASSFATSMITVRMPGEVVVEQQYDRPYDPYDYDRTRTHDTHHMAWFIGENKALNW